MSNAPPGVSISDVYNAIDSRLGPLRRDVQLLEVGLHDLRNHVDHEIRRLEEEMREIGQMIVHAIDRQTQAFIGGVAATTLMVERTKNQLESDFKETRGRIELQTESALQIEIGKKVAESTSLRSKLDAFGNDIKVRFEKSIEAAGINRELYNLNFAKIHEEYQNKIHTIGEHIFQIRMEDIAPAEKAARVPYETAHALPIEMDLKRLELRSQNLDETLAMLKSSRLDEVVHSIAELEGALSAYSLGKSQTSASGETADLVVEALVTRSSMQSCVVAGQQALPPEGPASLSLQLKDASLAHFDSPAMHQKLGQVLDQQTSRSATEAERQELAQAAQALREQGLISGEALTLLTDFLSADKLTVVEA
ncbi:MAG: hypothetical protein WCK08_12075 [Betaproteobacteria bacterium]